MIVPSEPPPLPWKFRTAPERLLLVLAVSAVILAAVFVFISHYAHFPWVCAWRGMTGIPCAGCGGTRAAVLLIRGDWWQALFLNPGVVLGAAALIGAALYSAAVVFFRLEPWRPRFQGWRWWLAAAVAVNWLYLLAVSQP